MPELEEPPPPTKTEAPASLKALFQIPSDLAEPTEPEVVPEVEPETPPIKPSVEPKTPPVVPVEEPKKKDDLTSRLAPDFATLETKPEVPVEPPLKITDEMIAGAKTPKAQADMRKFRESYERLEKEVAELKARPAIPAEDTETKTLLEMTKKERDDLLARLGRYDLQATPAFQEKYMKPRQQKFNDAYALVKESGGNPDALAGAMSLAGTPRIEALEEIAESIPGKMMRGRFERLIEGIDADSRIINEKLANAKREAEEEAKNEIIRRHENNEKTTRELKSLLGAARSSLLENSKLETLVKVGKPEFEWWDKQVDEIDEVAEEILLKSTPQKAAVAAYLAASAGAFRSMYQSERAARLAVEQENRELKGAEPNLTRERIAPKIEGDGVEPADILARLQSGVYKK